MTTYIACVLIALTLHRIWNYEDICARPRLWVANFTPLSCPACNAFWCSVPVAATAYALSELGGIAALALPFVAYPVLRLSAWCAEQSWANLFQARASMPQLTAAATAAARQAAARSQASAAPSVKAEPSTQTGCSSCAAKKEAILKERARTDAFRQRVVILTNLTDLNSPEAARAAEQASFLAQEPTRLVQIWIRANPDGSQPNVPQFLPNVDVRAVLPAPGSTSDQIASALIDKLIHLGNATIYSLDVMGVDLSITEAVSARVGRIRAFSWAHAGAPAALALPEHHIRAARTPTSALEVEALLAQAQPIPA